MDCLHGLYIIRASRGRFVHALQLEPRRAEADDVVMSVLTPAIVSLYGRSADVPAANK
jgi:hypothetical protein